MKIGKTWLIVGIIAIAAVIMYFVYTQSKTTVANKAGQAQVSARAQELAAKLPWETRNTIVGLYNWYEKNGGRVEMRDGIVFQVDKNQPDPWKRTSIERYWLDAALYDAFINKNLISSDMMSYLKINAAFTIAEFNESLKVM